MSLAGLQNRRSTNNTLTCRLITPYVWKCGVALWPRLLCNHFIQQEAFHSLLCVFICTVPSVKSHAELVWYIYPPITMPLLWKRCVMRSMPKMMDVSPWDTTLSRGKWSLGCQREHNCLGVLTASLYTALLGKVLQYKESVSVCPNCSLHITNNI